MPLARVLALPSLVLVAAALRPHPLRRRASTSVKGQVLAADPERNEVLVKHDDIKGFMPAMTMPYKVKDAALLSGKQPGDLVTATLVVEEVDAYLSALTTTGHAPLEAAAADRGTPGSAVAGSDRRRRAARRPGRRRPPDVRPARPSRRTDVHLHAAARCPISAR